MSEYDDEKKKGVIIEAPTDWMTTTGYAQTVEAMSVYEVVASTSDEPIFTNDVFEVKQIFGSTNDADLFIYAHGGDPIAPLIGVKESSVSERTMRALAEWELGERRKHREDTHREEIAKRDRTRLRLAIGAFVLAAFGLFAKLMGWI